jgi:hypothetical protein
MDIGSLFLNLGVRGTDKTVGALTNVKKGLSETASLSLEAKAGIVGAIYALERLFATSGKAGTNLANFNAVTGESVKTLQQYQYAARQVGISNEDVEGSFKGLQSAMTKTLIGEGAPKGLARVGLLTGGISQQDIKKFAEQPQLLIQRLQEYSKKETNIGLRNETLKSFGISEGMIAALSRQAFRPDVLKRAPTYSSQEIGQLDKANIAWSNLGNKIEMAVGHFNAKHGGQLVSDISKIVTQVIKLVEAFTKLSEQLHIFEVIGKVFEGWNLILGGVSSAVDSITGATKTSPGSILGNIIKTPAQSIIPNSAKNNATQLMNKSAVQNNNVKIDNHFQHPGIEHKKTEHSIKQAVQQAYRQMSAQAQGT